MTIKRVITLGEKELQRDASALAQLVARDYQPQAVLGIARGGIMVARLMRFDPVAPTLECTMRRAGSGPRGRWGLESTTLSRAPYFVSNHLRRIEDTLLGLRRPAPKPPTTDLICGIRKASESMVASGVRRVLVVDDAVDSGTTLQCVLSTIGSVDLLAGIEVRTAAIVVTRGPGAALVAPDYVLYRDILCRFPWSADFRRLQ